MRKITGIFIFVFIVLMVGNELPVSANVYSTNTDPTMAREFIMSIPNPREPGRFLLRYCHRVGNCVPMGSARGYAPEQFIQARRMWAQAATKQKFEDTLIAGGGAIAGTVAALVLVPESAIAAVVSETGVGVAEIAESTGAASAVSQAATRVAPQLVKTVGHMAGKLKTPVGMGMALSGAASTLITKIDGYRDPTGTNLATPFSLDRNSKKYIDDSRVLDPAGCFKTDLLISTFYVRMLPILRLIQAD